jgi:hypothetical protein
MMLARFEQAPIALVFIGQQVRINRHLSTPENRLGCALSPKVAVAI